MTYYGLTEKNISGAFNSQFNRLLKNHVLKRFMTFYERAELDKNCVIDK